MRIHIILALFVLALAVAACGPTRGPVEVRPFIGGTQGVVLSYVEGSPPKDTYDGGSSPFDIEVLLENKGETFVPKDKMRLRVTGIRPQEFNKDEASLEKNPDEDLTEVKKDNDGKVTPGNQVYVPFRELNHVSPITGAEQVYTLRTEACYTYGTTASSKLCVRSNILNPDAGGLCEIRGDKPVSSSGAPVQVSTVTESGRARDKIAFTFNLRHAGTGSVFEVASKCDKTSRKYDDRLKVVVDTSVSGLSCSGLSEQAMDGNKVVGYIKLNPDGTKSIQCQQVVSPLGDYELPVTITLGYDYEQFQDTAVIVKHVEG
ncbi:hypothetical protein HY642_05885 [Candidatus Woesearchaeota archaeon]|nr:hypothetical protein [Candidatus Woesearchaeota archaeon]